MAERQLRVREGEEIWETTTEGRVWVTTSDARNKEKPVSVGGQVGQRLRISVDDREINQDAIMNAADDPFVNGLLKRIDQDQNDDERTKTDQALSSEDLAKLFAKSGNAFQSAVRKLNELNVRRLREMAEGLDASGSQVRFLDEHVAEHYRNEGTMPSYNEMLASGLIRSGGV